MTYNQQEAKTRGPKAARKYIPSTTRVNLEANSSAAKPPDDNAVHLRSALCDPEQRTQLSHAQTPDPQKLR